MNTKTKKTTKKWLRMLACGLSILLAGGWLFIAIVSVFTEPEPVTWESWMIAGMILMSVILTAVAWLRSRIGGVLLFLHGLAFGTFAYISAGHNEWFAVLVSGFPFLVVGILFFLSYRPPTPYRFQP